MDSKKKFYKITNVEENHHGYQFQDGLNVLVEEFNDKPEPYYYIGKGGFHFSGAENIFEDIRRNSKKGFYVREVTLPKFAEKALNMHQVVDKCSLICDKIGYTCSCGSTNKYDTIIDEENLVDEKFRIVKGYGGYKANMIILGARYELSKEETGVSNAIPVWETLKMLVDAEADHHAAVLYGATHGCLDLVKYILEKEKNLRLDYSLMYAAENGYLEIVKCLVNAGANIHANDDGALKLSA